MILKPPLFAKPIRGHPLGPDGGLVGCWPMNEGRYNSTSTKVFDLSGNGNTGTFSDTDLSWVPGKYGSAVDFPGANEYIDCGNGPSLQITSKPITVVVVVKFDAFNTYPVITSKWNPVAGGRGWYIAGWNDGQVRFATQYADDSTSTYIESVGSCVADTWYQIAGVYDGGNIYIYVDGDGLHEVNSKAQANGLQNSSYQVQLGIYASVSQPLNGQFSHVMIYNRSLSASEIAQLYLKPFCMFERDPIELWSAATLGAAPPAGMAGAMTTNAGYWGW